VRLAAGADPRRPPVARRSAPTYADSLRCSPGRRERDPYDDAVRLGIAANAAGVEVAFESWRTESTSGRCSALRAARIRCCHRTLATFVNGLSGTHRLRATRATGRRIARERRRATTPPGWQSGGRGLRRGRGGGGPGGFGGGGMARSGKLGYRPPSTWQEHESARHSRPVGVHTFSPVKEPLLQRRSFGKSWPGSHHWNAGQRYTPGRFLRPAPAGAPDPRPTPPLPTREIRFDGRFLPKSSQSDCGGPLGGSWNARPSMGTGQEVTSSAACDQGVAWRAGQGVLRVGIYVAADTTGISTSPTGALD